VIHVMGRTFICAPFANVRAQAANLFDEGAIAHDCISAQAADCGTFNTAGWACVDAFLADHVRKTSAALRCAKVAGVDAGLGILIQMATHFEIP
jgi:hypothetical protein